MALFLASFRGKIIYHPIVHEETDWLIIWNTILARIEIRSWDGLDVELLNGAIYGDDDTDWRSQLSMSLNEQKLQRSMTDCQFAMCLMNPRHSISEHMEQIEKFTAWRTKSGESND